MTMTTSNQELATLLGITVSRLPAATRHRTLVQILALLGDSIADNPHTLRNQLRCELLQPHELSWMDEPPSTPVWVVGTGFLPLEFVALLELKT
jgi:hypothetical protein